MSTSSCHSLPGLATILSYQSPEAFQSLSRLGLVALDRTAVPSPSTPSHTGSHEKLAFIFWLYKLTIISDIIS